MPVISTIEGLQHLFRKCVPKMFADYVDSSSWTESTYRVNDAIFVLPEIVKAVGLGEQGVNLAFEVLMNS